MTPTLRETIQTALVGIPHPPKVKNNEELRCTDNQRKQLTSLFLKHSFYTFRVTQPGPPWHWQVNWITASCPNIKLLEKYIDSNVVGWRRVVCLEHRAKYICIYSNYLFRWNAKEITCKYQGVWESVQALKAQLFKNLHDFFCWSH